MYQKSIRVVCMALVISVLAMIGCFAGDTAEVKHFGKIDGKPIEFEAEDVTINANFTINEVTNQPTVHSQKVIRTEVMLTAVPATGTKGDIEFSFNTGKEGEYAIWAYAYPESVTKSIALAQNGGDYTEVKVGAIAKEYQWTKLLTISAKGDEKITISAAGRNAYFNIDKFVIADASFVPENPVPMETTAPAETTAAPAATTKPAGTNPSAPATAEPMAIALVALTLSAVGIVVAKKRK